MNEKSYEIWFVNVYVHSVLFYTHRESLFGMIDTLLQYSLFYVLQLTYIERNSLSIAIGPGLSRLLHLLLVDEFQWIKICDRTENSFSVSEK